MKIQKDRIIKLYERNRNKKIRDDEKIEFQLLLSDPVAVKKLEVYLIKRWSNISSEEENSINLARSEYIYNFITDHPQKSPVRRVRIWRHIIAAASVVIFIGIGFYFYKKPNTSSITISKENDIAPGSNKALLTLANGKRIVLTNVKNGEITKQAGTNISKVADGQLVYSILNSGPTPLEKNEIEDHNTLETPAGGQYQIQLPDGTKVWLNAASSLKFPTKFVSSERKVELSGEAYFEVARDKKHPFIVRTDKQEVEVLGTHFNINAYKDEPNSKTTLLEGSVKIISNPFPQSRRNSSIAQNTSITLKPTQQSILQNNKINVLTVDVQEAVAWKNGEFIFNNESLESIMRKVSRWYNVEVVYANEELKKQPFGGEISRFTNVSKILEVLELTGFAHFKIEGRRILVEK